MGAIFDDPLQLSLQSTKASRLIGMATFSMATVGLVAIVTEGVARISPFGGLGVAAYGIQSGKAKKPKTP
jgi:hypothetical protein